MALPSAAVESIGQWALLEPAFCGGEHSLRILKTKIVVKPVRDVGSSLASKRTPG